MKQGGIGCLVVGLVLGAIGIVLLGDIAPLGIFVLFAAAVAGVVGGFLLRKGLAESYYTVVLGPVPAAVALGESFEWRVAVRARRASTLGPAQAVLRCQEHAISRGGTSDSHYRQTIYEEGLHMGHGRDVHPGDEAVLEAAVTIPRLAVPSFSGRNNSIEWKLILNVPVPGYCPDIKEEVPLHVLPELVVVDEQQLAEDPTIPAVWAQELPVAGQRAEWGGVRAELVTGGPTIGGLPAVGVGGTRELTLQVHTAEHLDCRGLQLWVGCRIHGSGTEEKVELSPEHLISQGPLLVSQPIVHRLQVAIPGRGPVSFLGRYVKCEWLLRLRVDIPIWRDQRLDLPLLVTPRALAGREEHGSGATPPAPEAASDSGGLPPVRLPGDGA